MHLSNNIFMQRVINFPFASLCFRFRKGDWIFYCCIDILRCIFNMWAINSEYLRLFLLILQSLSLCMPHGVTYHSSAHQSGLKGERSALLDGWDQGMEMQPHHVSLLPLSWFHNGSLSNNGGWIIMVCSGIMRPYLWLGGVIILFFKRLAKL